MEVVTNELIARAVASLVGALVALPLAILPWVEAGLGEGSGVGCRKALNELKRDREKLTAATFASALPATKHAAAPSARMRGVANARKASLQSVTGN